MTIYYNQSLSHTLKHETSTVTPSCTLHFLKSMFQPNITFLNMMMNERGYLNFHGAHLNLEGSTPLALKVSMHTE